MKKYFKIQDKYMDVKVFTYMNISKSPDLLVPLTTCQIFDRLLFLTDGYLKSYDMQSFAVTSSVLVRFS